MSNLKKHMAALLIPALLLALGTGVSAAEIPEPDVAICYQEDLTDSEYLGSLTMPALYRVEDGQLRGGICSLPEDVTAAHAGNENFGIGADEIRGRAFRICLNPGLYWEDGKAVTADDVVDTVLARLEEFPWIANGEAYLAGLERPAQEIVSLKEAGFASASDARDAGYGRFYIDLEGFWGLDAGWKSVEDRRQIIDHAMMPGLDEACVTPAYLYRNYLAEGMGLAYFQSAYLGVAAQREKLTEADLGIQKTGDLEILIITAEPMTAQTLAARLAELRLQGSGCYGPYRITDEGADEIRLERNPYWQGETHPADVIRFLGR